MLAARESYRYKKWVPQLIITTKQVFGNDSKTKYRFYRSLGSVNVLWTFNAHLKIITSFLHKKPRFSYFFKKSNNKTLNNVCQILKNYTNISTGSESHFGYFKIIFQQKNQFFMVLSCSSLPLKIYLVKKISSEVTRVLRSTLKVVPFSQLWNFDDVMKKTTSASSNVFTATQMFLQLSNFLRDNQFSK